MEKINLSRTNSDNPDFTSLVKELDAYLAICDGDEHGFYDQYNKLDKIKNVVVAYVNDKPAGCGAFKKYDDQSVEIKRMYVHPDFRQQGLASKILNELENWSNEIGFSRCILETGKRQVEAVNFYHRQNYKLIPNYAPYEDMYNSLCFAKELN